MNKSSIFLKIMALALMLPACEGSKVRKDSIELDPEVAAQVKEINMERYAGSWLMPGTKGSLYMELTDHGYYLVTEDKNGQALQSDFGSIDHYKPGLMIMKTDRAECKDDGIVFLKMDQHEGTVRLRSFRQGNLAVPLVAVEPRERLRNSPGPCLEY